MPEDNTLPINITVNDVLTIDAYSGFVALHYTDKAGVGQYFLIAAQRPNITIIKRLTKDQLSIIAEVFPVLIKVEPPDNPINTLLAKYRDAQARLESLKAKMAQYPIMSPAWRALRTEVNATQGELYEITDEGWLKYNVDIEAMYNNSGGVKK